MTERIEKLLEIVRKKPHHAFRDQEKGHLKASSDFQSNHQFFMKNIAKEKPYLLEEDRFGFHRSASFTYGGGSGNIVARYSLVLENGLEELARRVDAALETAGTEDQKVFAFALKEEIAAILAHAENYRKLAEEKGCKELAAALSNVPAKGARNFYEACVVMAMLLYLLRVGGTEHTPLGRFDQYMYPFFKKDLERGVAKEELFETLEEFFLTLNLDTDLYTGFQQGDNGQSMVLGGCDAEGKDAYNELSEMCLKASLELNVIDPKINLRVSKETPFERYLLGTELTKKGLGFPQYCNDDVAIKGLVQLGYDLEDARDYAVAACWEYIPSGCAADIPNLNKMDFPGAVQAVVCASLMKCERFEDLMLAVQAEIEARCDEMIREAATNEQANNQALPLLSMMIDGCIEKLSDCSKGAKYLNYGAHGAGISNAADALAAIKKKVFEEKSISKEELLAALDADFEGYSELRAALRSCPKMGNNEDFVDDIAIAITDYYAEYLNNKPNGIGGIWRAGTGSAMEYLFLGSVCPATADGRKAGTCYGSAYSPALDVPLNGLLSVIQSFTKYDLSKIINGGPLTLELHDSVLRNDVGIEKVAKLVELYIKRGGHQLQLNSINRDVLLDAQAHPENHAELIVRVWGWSGYFNELDKDYQDHVIRRVEFSI